MNFERARNGAFGWVKPSDFWQLPNVNFKYGPLSFRMHDLDKHKWCMSFAQKRTANNLFRAKVRIYDRARTESGFTIKLPNREFHGWHGVALALASLDGGVCFHAHQELNFATPAREVISADVPIEEALARHNAETLASFGDWRPKPDAPPDRSNVILLRALLKEIEDEAA